MRKLTAEEFRRELAGIGTDKAPVEVSRETIGQCADFLALLPRYYGADLDRISMWTRIANGITACVAKSGGSVERFCHEMLAYIHADPSRLGTDVLALPNTSSLVALGEGFREADKRDIEAEILECFQHRALLLIPMAKERWESHKETVKAQARQKRIMEGK